MNQAELHLLATDIKKAALIFRAVKHPLRQQMLRLMHENASINVTTLYTKLRLEQSVASQHLSILRGAGVVQTQKVGKEVLYSVQYERLQKIQAVAKALIYFDGKPAKTEALS
jgi:DNA-binding transcriptional ArsR family regulator